MPPLYLVDMAIEGESLPNLCEVVKFVNDETYDPLQEERIVTRAAQLAGSVEEILKFVNCTRIMSMGNLAVRAYAEKVHRNKGLLTCEETRQLVQSITNLHKGSANAARRALAAVAPFKAIVVGDDTKLGDIVDMSFVAYLCEDYLRRDTYFARIGLHAVNQLPNHSRLLTFCRMIDVTWFKNKVLVLWATTGKANNAKEVADILGTLAKEPGVETDAYAIINATLGVITNDQLATLDTLTRIEKHAPENLGLDPRTALSNAARRIALRDQEFKKPPKK